MKENNIIDHFENKDKNINININYQNELNNIRFKVLNEKVEKKNFNLNKIKLSYFTYAFTFMVSIFMFGQFKDVQNKSVNDIVYLNDQSTTLITDPDFYALFEYEKYDYEIIDVLI